MATSREEAQQMIEAANNNNKKLMIGHNQRFVSSHKKQDNSLQMGKSEKFIASVLHLVIRGPEGWSVDGVNSWFFNKEQAFIGAMGDLGVHKTDLMRYILG